MQDIKKSTLHASRHPSLLPLRKVLTAAERVVPARPRLHNDVHEQLASRLIEKVQKDHKRSNLFVNLKEMVNTDV